MGNKEEDDDDYNDMIIRDPSCDPNSTQTQQQRQQQQHPTTTMSDTNNCNSIVISTIVPKKRTIRKLVSNIGNQRSNPLLKGGNLVSKKVTQRTKTDGQTSSLLQRNGPSTISTSNSNNNISQQTTNPILMESSYDLASNVVETQKRTIPILSSFTGTRSQEDAGINLSVSINNMSSEKPQATSKLSKHHKPSDSTKSSSTKPKTTKKSIGTSNKSTDTAIMSIFQRYNDMQETIDQLRNKRKSIQNDLSSQQQQIHTIQQQRKTEEEWIQKQKQQQQQQRPKQQTEEPSVGNDDDANIKYNSVYDKYHLTKQEYERWKLWKVHAFERALEESKTFRTKCIELRRTMKGLTSTRTETPDRYYCTNVSSHATLKALEVLSNSYRQPPNGESFEQALSEYDDGTTGVDNSDDEQQLNVMEQSIINKFRTNQLTNSTTTTIDGNEISQKSRNAKAIGTVDMAIESLGMQCWNLLRNNTTDQAQLGKLKQNELEPIIKKYKECQERYNSLQVQYNRLQNDNTQLEKQIQEHQTKLKQMHTPVQKTSDPYRRITNHNNNNDDSHASAVATITPQASSTSFTNTSNSNTGSVVVTNTGPRQTFGVPTNPYARTAKKQTSTKGPTGRNTHTIKNTKQRKKFFTNTSLGSNDNSPVNIATTGTDSIANMDYIQNITTPKMENRSPIGQFARSNNIIDKIKGESNFVATNKREANTNVFVRENFDAAQNDNFSRNNGSSMKTPRLHYRDRQFGCSLKVSSAIVSTVQVYRNPRTTDTSQPDGTYSESFHDCSSDIVSKNYQKTPAHTFTKPAKQRLSSNYSNYSYDIDNNGDDNDDDGILSLQIFNKKTKKF